VDGVPPLLQPVAHSLLQCREEVMAALPGLSAEQIWARRNGAASIGFHVRHAAGALERLLTYARGEPLSPAQVAAAKAEQEPDLAPDAAARLLVTFDEAVERALDQLRGTSTDTLTERRGVGRANLRRVTRTVVKSPPCAASSDRCSG
jgi:hypothetical protein